MTPELLWTAFRAVIGGEIGYVRSLLRKPRLKAQADNRIRGFFAFAAVLADMAYSEGLRDGRNLTIRPYPHIPVEEMEAYKRFVALMLKDEVAPPEGQR